MDGDGELRLTIMATLAQEESRKVSERVKAGQQISRINGTIYGCGNILGYDRVGDTYVKNPDQSETVRMIYDMYQVEKSKKVNLTGIVAQIERYKNKKNTLLEMRTDGEISKEEYKEQKEKIEKALLELTEEYERMLATEDAIQNPDICWDEIHSSLDAMIDFSNPQIDRHIIRKFVSKIVPNGRNHFRWYMNLDGKDTTTLDMVTEGRKNNAVISFNDDEEDEPPLHIGDVIGLTELQQYFPNLLKNENQNGIITTVGKCGKKSSLDAILHRQLSKVGRSSLSFELPLGFKEAEAYRKANGKYVRKNQWRDTTVTVEIDLD